MRPGDDWPSWFLRSAAGVLAALGLTGVVLGAIVAVAVATQGGEIVEPLAGVAVLTLAVGAFTSVGMAVGGLVRASLAAPVAGLLVIATFLLDTLGAALDLPDAILDLSLYRHLGQPMAGEFEVTGLVIATMLILGGLAIGAWGLQRRDLDR
jgi:ABC-2 type transport system permease protein